MYLSYYKSHNTEQLINKDACPYCFHHIKQQEVLMKKYGTANPLEVNGAVDKRKKTCLEKYGSESFLASDIAKEKIAKTNIEKYGGRSPMKDSMVVEHRKQNCLEKYGVDSTNKIPEIRDKYEKTMLERYGSDRKEILNKTKKTCIEKYGENYNEIFQKRAEDAMIEKYGKKCSMQVDFIREKMLKTLSENVSSKMEDSVYETLKDIYGEKVQHSVVQYDFILDFVLNIDDCKINIEYDGWYWHKDRLEADKRRNNFLINRGYKVLRIRSKRDLPTKEQIVTCIDYLVKDNHTYKELNLDID
jgi:very-short-patch-repair endonuclease